MLWVFTAVCETTPQTEWLLRQSSILRGAWAQLGGFSQGVSCTCDQKLAGAVVSWAERPRGLTHVAGS